MPVWSTFTPGDFSRRWQAHSQRFPRWGLPILLLAAVPAILIALLSILLLATSLLALLLLTVPTFKIIVWLSNLGSGRGANQPSSDPLAEERLPSPGSKPVEVRIVDP